MDDPEQKQSYRQKLVEERDWHQKTHLGRGQLLGRILHHPLVFSYERAEFVHRSSRERMRAALERFVATEVDLLLDAPCGWGRDFDYVKRVARAVYGLDLSPVPLDRCQEEMGVAVGDVLQLPYPDATFDVVVSTLFLHHFRRFGFVPFLQEFWRVLKPGGGIMILEPSRWYPLNLITRPLKKLGNPFDEIEDEGPVSPGDMERAMVETGFAHIDVQAATFSHPAFYTPLARTVDRLMHAFLRTCPFKYAGWLLLYWGQKPIEPAAVVRAREQDV
jgi:SAM-dependent methyltransferase